MRSALYTPTPADLALACWHCGAIDAPDIFTGHGTNTASISCKHCHHVVYWYSTLSRHTLYARVRCAEAASPCVAETAVQHA